MFTPAVIEFRGETYGYIYNADESRRVGFSFDYPEPGLNTWPTSYYPQGNWEPTRTELKNAARFLNFYQQHKED